jgi:hypothetical protein
LYILITEGAYAPSLDSDQTSIRARLAKLEFNFFYISCYLGLRDCKQGWSDARPLARPLRMIDLQACSTRKYFGIFEHIQVYMRYFQRIFREYD